MGVCLLRGDWIVEAAASKPTLQLPRRQELPSDAGWHASQLAERLGEPKKKAVAIVAISYCWLAADHPDPSGDHLKLIAPLVSSFAGPGGCSTWHGEVGQKHQHVFQDLWKPVAGDKDVAIFFDFC